MTRLQLLGGAHIETEAGRVAFLPDKRFQFLAYLAYAGDWVDRARLGFLFWPDVESEQARHNLRQLLRRVQDLGWATGLETERQRLRWPVETDAARFLGALQAGAFAEALSCYRGPLLPDLDGDGEFADWLMLERERLHGLWRGAVFEISHGGADALPALRALLEHDPLDEEALQTLMAHAARLGQPEVALGAYRAFAKHLRHEVNLTPSAATLHLAEAIAAGRDASLTAWSQTLVRARTPAALPVPDTSFVGRDLELGDALELLRQPGCRLLSVTGPGGVGKTRLALQAAREAAAWYPDGLAVAMLAGLSADAAVPACIAAALGLALYSRDDVPDQLVRHLSGRAVLLVLDNSEHLQGVAPLAARLLAKCPRLKLLATSRERFNLAGEWLFPLAGMAYPGADVGLAEAQAYDAVRLFCERTRQVLPDFALTPDTLPHVRRICRLVAGSPLALELAAAWVRSVPLAVIAQEIASNLDFLATSAPDVPERHRSLRATFEQSWRRLSRDEQDALRFLSVFRGGFTAEAAQAVARAPVVLLAALVDKSLLRLLPGARYERHPLLYQYMKEALSAEPDAERSARSRHAAHYLALAEVAEQDLVKNARSGWLARLSHEHGNLQVALDWAADHDVASGLRLAGALKWYWWYRGHLREGQARLRALLAQPEAADHPEACSAALAAAGELARLCGEFGAARSLLEEALSVHRSAGSERAVAALLNSLGLLATHMEEYAAAQAHHEEALAIRQRLGDPHGVAGSLNNLGEVARYVGNLPLAQTLYEECLSLVRRVVGERHGAAYPLANLGSVAIEMGDARSAQRYFHESLLILQDIGDEPGAAAVLEGYAILLSQVGDAEGAARLWGSAEAQMERLDMRPSPADAHAVRAAQREARAALGAAGFAALWAEGRELTLEHALSDAIATSQPRG